MNVVISQPMLFPWPGFFEHLMMADVFVYLDDAQFSKGGYSNRIQVRIGDSRKWMTIPLAGKGNFQTIHDLKPAHEKWFRDIRNILLASSMHVHYKDDVLSLFDSCKDASSICKFLISSIEKTSEYLSLDGSRRVFRSSQIGIPGSSWSRVLSLVKHFGGTKYITGHGAANYLDHEAFEREGIEVEYVHYSMTSWNPADAAFTPYVTTLDLIGHHGPQARNFLHPSSVPWRKFMEERQASATS